MSLVFVDIETTGLEDYDEITELSYAEGVGEVKNLYFGVKVVPEFIDNLTKYYERGIHKLPKSSQKEFDAFLETSSGNTIVCANPEFDVSFLKRAGLFNFTHRKLDIESYAMKALELDYMPSMSKIYELLTDLGYEIFKPNHSAGGDVIAMRQMFFIMKNHFKSERLV